MTTNIISHEWYDDYHEIPGYWSGGREDGFRYTEVNFDDFDYEYVGGRGGLMYLGVKSHRTVTKGQLITYLENIKKDLKKHGLEKG